ncbi:MAG: hypothetical protein MJE77_36030 [Proteobacteria bacterium]|nr:hypothetical protein [Pseudomonadota bacterium]
MSKYISEPAVAVPRWALTPDQAKISLRDSSLSTRGSALQPGSNADAIAPISTDTKAA